MNGCYYNDEIKAEDLVRTEEGVIVEVRKNTTIFNDDGELFIDAYYLPYEQKIVKHSKDIKELLEIKDVIHYRIDNISTTLETKGYIESIVDIKDEEMLESIKENPDYHILEVLTKEQWKLTAYTIHEREKKENERD